MPRGPEWTLLALLQGALAGGGGVERGGGGGGGVYQSRLSHYAGGWGWAGFLKERRNDGTWCS